MPIYEYHCDDCGLEFSKLMRFSDPDIDSQPCTGCQSDHTFKKLSTIAVMHNNSLRGTTANNCGSSGPFT